ASTGRAQEALPIADLAVMLAPWNPITVASLADVAMELGECPRAVVLQTRAVEIAEALEFETSDSFDKGIFRRKLTDYRARCEAAQAGHVSRSLTSCACLKLTQ